MMKKKVHDQKESEQRYFNNSTDNKENTHNPEQNNGNESSIPQSGDPKTAGAESINSGETADKVVAEEKNFEEKLAEMHNKYIRLSAEYDNYRKRTLREKMELSRYAGENLLLKIIPLMDDFDRALKLMDTATDCVAMKNGIDLIYGKFTEFLKQNGVKEIESMNSTFDVDLHEAVAKVPVDEDDKKGKVVDVLQKGYYLQDKILRFSKVVVGE